MSRRFPGDLRLRLRIRPLRGGLGRRLAAGAPALATTVARRSPLRTRESLRLVERHTVVRELRSRVETVHTIATRHTATVTAAAHVQPLRTGEIGTIRLLQAAAPAAQRLATVLTRHLRIEPPSVAPPRVAAAAPVTAASPAAVPMEVRRAPHAQAMQAVRAVQAMQAAQDAAHGGGGASFAAPFAVDVAPGRPQRAQRAPITAQELDIEDVTNHVVRRIERRIWAQRERRGEM